MSKKYDSKFEKLIDEKFPEIEYHPTEKVPYVMEHEYEPDFIYYSTKKFYIESKGRFRDRKESSKYPAIKKSLLENEEIIFILMKRNTPMPNAKKRKDGTKQTMEEFLEKNGFRYFYIDNFNTEEL